MRTLNDYFLTARLDDISSADQVYIAIPDGGHVVRVDAAIANAITTADATLTAKTANGTVGTVTAAFSGSAAGSVFSGEFQPVGVTGYVPTGGYVEVETDGASSTAAETLVTVTIRR